MPSSPNAVRPGTRDRHVDGTVRRIQKPVLILLKTVHSIIWVVMSAANVTAFYLAFVGRFNTWFVVAITLLAIEVFIIAVNSWHCR